MVSSVKIHNEAGNKRLNLLHIPENGEQCDVTFSFVEPVNESEEFCCMFRSRLGCHSVVYGAEMDGFRTRAERADEDNRDMLDLNLDGTFVELKTSRVIDNKRLQNTFAEFKTLKW